MDFGNIRAQTNEFNRGFAAVTSDKALNDVSTLASEFKPTMEEDQEVSINV